MNSILSVDLFLSLFFLFVIAFPPPPPPPPRLLDSLLQMLIAMIIVAIGVTFLSLILTVIWLLKASGLFTTIKINLSRPSFELLTIVYKFQQGDYSQAADIFKDLLHYCPAHSTIGIYYDNATVVRRDGRSCVGDLLLNALDAR
jgi:hypothetical protein